MHYIINILLHVQVICGFFCALFESLSLPSVLSLLQDVHLSVFEGDLERGEAETAKTPRTPASQSPGSRGWRFACLYVIFMSMWCSFFEKRWYDSYQEASCVQLVSWQFDSSFREWAVRTSVNSKLDLTEYSLTSHLYMQINTHYWDKWKHWASFTNKA